MNLIKCKKNLRSLVPCIFNQIIKIHGIFVNCVYSFTAESLGFLPRGAGSGNAEALSEILIKGNPCPCIGVTVKPIPNTTGTK